MYENIQTCVEKSFLLVVVEERYSSGYGAYLGSDTCPQELADLITGGDNDWAATLNLKGSDWYPYVTGTTVEAALAALNSKIAPFVHGGDATFSKWLEYVGLLSSRLHIEKAYRIIDNNFDFMHFKRIDETKYLAFIDLFD